LNAYETSLTKGKIPMVDELLSALRTSELPNAAEARQRAIDAARQAYRSRPVTARPFRAARLVAATALLAVFAFCFTAPGHAATGWVGRLVGIGDVGGPPSVDQPVGSTRANGSKVVIANGSAPDGSRYELVAFQSAEDGTCIEVEFPRLGNGTHASGQCTADQPIQALNGFGFTDYSPANGDNQPSATPVSGIVGDNVARVKVSYQSAGIEQDIEADVAQLTPELQKQIGAPDPLGAFIAFLPVQNTDEGTEQPRQVNVTAYDASGHELHDASGQPATSGIPPASSPHAQAKPLPLKVSDVHVRRRGDPHTKGCPGAHPCFTITLSPRLKAMMRSSHRIPNDPQLMRIVKRKSCALMTKPEAAKDASCRGH
jgi:hypothetical protein